MEELMDLMFDIGEAYLKKTDGQDLIKQETAATLILAKKIDEQTAILKELIREIVALTNKR